MECNTAGLRAGILCGLLLAGPLPSAADPLPGRHPLLNKRLDIGVGGFFPEIDSRIRLDSDRFGLGTSIDFEDELGLEDSKDVAWAKARWRLSRRNSLELEWVRLDRQASVGTSPRSYRVGNTTIQAGGRIDSLFELDLYRLTYGFSLIRSEHADLQLQLGAHVADVNARLILSGTVSFDDGQSFTQAVTEEGGELTAPLPHAGGNFSFALTDKLGLYANALGFALEVDDIDGSILEAGATLQYNLTPNLGVGAGLRYFEVDVESGDPDLRGEFEFEYLGPVVYGSFSF